MLHLAVKEVLTLTGIFDFMDRPGLIADILSPYIIWSYWESIF
jgi:hypothetical protein